MKVHYVLLMMILSAVLSVSVFTSCTKEMDNDGIWEYVNETALDCTIRIYSNRDGKADFVNLQIPAGNREAIFYEAYYMGSCVVNQYSDALIEFSDGAKIEYTKRDGKVGNPLMEENYYIQPMGDRFLLSLKITEDIHKEALK